MKRYLAIAVFMITASLGANAHGEFYVGIGGGLSFGGSISGFSATGARCSFFIIPINPTCSNFSYSGSSLDMDSATVLGGKIGYYSENPDWLGIEFEYFQRDIEVSRQPWNAQGNNTTQLLPTNPFSGQAEWDGKIQTFGLNFLARIPSRIMVEKFNLSRWEPYVGLGFSINVLEVGPMRTYDNAGNLVGSSLASPEADYAWGYLGTIGLNFKLHDRWKLYGEYKYSNFSYGEDRSISEFDTGASGEVYRLDIKVNESIFMFGVTYNFGSASN